MQRHVFAFAAVAALSLAACGGGGGSSTTPTGSSPAPGTTATPAAIPTGDPTTTADGMTLSTDAMCFSAVDTSSSTTYEQTFTVTEPDSYTGTLSATSSNLNVATVSPANQLSAGTGGTTFTVNPIGVGDELPIITVTDSNNNKATIKITVTTTKGSIQ